MARFSHYPMLLALGMALACVPALGQETRLDPVPEQAPALDWTLDALAQWTSESTRSGPAFGGVRFATHVGEARIDIGVKCQAGPCAGMGMIFKPRLRYYRVGDEGAALPEPRRAGFTELYAAGRIGQSGSWSLGKRYLSWGPGLLYSPTNRLFPDNGFSQPRRELGGKTLAMASAGAGEWVLSALAADPHAVAADGREQGGSFFLARAERSEGSDRPLTAGLVAGGGGGLERYAGLYVQKLLDDAWTVGAELSVSRAYGRARHAGAARAKRVDGLVNLRYGMASGGEVGLEFIYNGHSLSDAEYANPVLAYAPAGGEWQARHFQRHPLAERRYVVLQGSWPNLFGDRRFGLLFRSLHGLERHGGSDFVEASFSPGDRVTAYLGATRTRGAEASVLRRALARNVYLTLQLYF